MFGAFNDPFWPETKLLLPLSGPKNNKALANYSAYPVSFSAKDPGTGYVENPARGYESSWLFMQDADFLLSGVGLGSGDFTVDAWIGVDPGYSSPSGRSERTLVGVHDDTDRRYEFGVVGGQIQVWLGIGLFVAAGPQVFYEGMHHAAWQMRNTIFSMWVDGENVYETDLGGVRFSEAWPSIGNYRTETVGIFGFQGLVNDLRITHAARYNAPFVPPQEPLLPQALLSYFQLTDWINLPKFTLNGRVITTSGTPVEKIVLFDWNKKQTLWTITPELGQWQAQVIAGTYGVMYFANGCAPVIHGPYSVGD